MSALGATGYRVGQFLRTLTARVPEEDLASAGSLLSPAQMALFRRQSRYDQRHALAVCARLREEGYDDRDLLMAALLHDVGKAAGRLHPWQRATIVLLERFAPHLLAWLGDGNARGWRRPFIVHCQHPQVGARWAEEAGCSPRTVTLIRQHHELVGRSEKEENARLAALQAADRAN